MGQLLSKSEIRKRTVVVVPVHNEEQIVGSVIEQLRCQFDHIVCIDDGSTDGTFGILSQLEVVLIRHLVNLGQGAAIRTGLSFIVAQNRFDYVVTFDSDGQHRAEDAREMVEKLEVQDLDFVVGSRFLGIHSPSMPRFRGLVLQALALISRTFLKHPYTDTHNGLRAIRASVVQMLIPTQRGMAHATEICTMAVKNGLRISEHPVRVEYTEYSLSKGQRLFDGAKILKDLMFR